MTAPGESTGTTGLDALLRAVLFQADGSFRLAHRPAADSPEFPPDRLPGELYLHGFARRIGAPGALSPREPSSEELARRLVAAHPGQKRWREGWRVEEVLDRGRLVVSRGHHRREVTVGEYAPTLADSVPARVGVGVTVLFPKDSLTLQPGTYCGFGAALPSADESETLRLYWNAPSTLVADLLACLVPPLDDAGVPFTFKTMLEPADRDRLDRTVLYVPCRRYRLVEPVLESLPATMWQGLGADVPLFTLRLAPGLGLAETPRTGESFGLHRCRLVAEALAACGRRGQDSPEQRRAAVRSRFAAEGISGAAPHLEGGSEHVYRQLQLRGGELAP